MPGHADESHRARIDRLIGVFETMIDGHRRVPNAHDRLLLGEFSAADVREAFASLRAEADAAADSVMAQIDDPAGPAAQLAAIVHAGAPDPFAGLPGNAAGVYALRIMWPDPTPEQTASITELTSNWTPDDHALLEERFGHLLPAGRSHPPD